jgi:DNA-binding SARP family transcriptional activator
LGSSTRIQLCGRLAVEVAGRDVTGLLPSRQGRVLVGYLVAHRLRVHARDELIEALWPGRAPASAESALSALLSGLRRALGPGAIAGRSQVRLVLPEGAHVDVEAAEEAIHRAESAILQGDWSRAWSPSLVALFTARRRFLPEADASWADEWRRHLEEVRLRALECYAAAALGIGGAELPVGERAARELVAAAPFRERGHGLLMKVLLARGETAEALRVYETLRRRLREELGTSPGPEIRALQAALLRQIAAGTPTTGA